MSIDIVLLLPVISNSSYYTEYRLLDVYSTCFSGACFWATNLSGATVPCEWEWGEYGDCSATCDGGTQSRVAIIITPAQHGGYCPPEVGRPDTRACNTQDCPRENTLSLLHTITTSALPYGWFNQLAQIILIFMDLFSFFTAACPNPDDNNCLINGVYKCIYDPDRDCVEQVKIWKFVAFSCEATHITGRQLRVCV